MLDELFNQLAVPPVPPPKKAVEPLQPTAGAAVPLVPLVPPEKTKVETQNRYRETHAAVKAFYLMQGKTEADWERVNNNPAKFNRVWRQMLGMPLSDKPPFIGGSND